MQIAIVRLQGKAEGYGRDLEIVGCYFYSRERIEFDLIATADLKEWYGRGRVCLALQTSLASDFVTWGEGERDRQTGRQAANKQTKNRERERERINESMNQ